MKGANLLHFCRNDEHNSLDTCKELYNINTHGGYRVPNGQQVSAYIIVTDQPTSGPGCVLTPTTWDGVRKVFFLILFSNKKLTCLTFLSSLFSLLSSLSSLLLSSPFSLPSSPFSLFLL